MPIKKLKIIIDIFMLIAVICSYRRWEGEPTFHIIAGSFFPLLLFIHFIINRKTFISFNKNIKKLNTPIRLKCLIDWILIVIWSVTIISGLFSFLLYNGTIETAFNMKRFHGIFARIGGGLIIIHIIQHGKQIMSYFKRKQA